MKIGIIGGTFNPIHLGHLLLAEWAKDAFSLDRILVMPTGISYLKEGTNVLPGEERLHMVQLALEERTDMVAEELEVRRGGFTYTHETLEALTEFYPQDSFYFICGSDILFSIENWKDPQRIFNLCTLVAAVRGDESMDEMKQKRDELVRKFHANIEVFPFMNFSVSSTEVRNRIKEGKSVTYLVPDKVLAYIEEKGFYRG